jgi:hypothetical protein
MKVTKESSIQQKNQQQQFDLTPASLQNFKYFYSHKNRINQNNFNTIKNTNSSNYNINFKNQATSLCTINNINNINNSSQKYSSYYYYNPASFNDLTINTRKQWCPIKIESFTRYLKNILINLKA